ncbi:hypothetical protein FYJ43_02265 [Cutibacterium sp. WCA-380-WT-3A]|uniref:ABC transporter permease n=1 Tax=Cutibacterium porci TaxID=2605781 RepID=A0A7K0J4P0_9ACTN|nr:hypothetical protein [Cutibacterium porci]MSS44895.1 hypothetical protein [Cutibacterium porci]
MTGIATIDEKASFGNLIIAESRKFIDTRASVWLLSIAAILSLIVAAVSGRAITTHISGDLAWSVLFSFTVMPINALLPIVAILMVTAEWSHRTALMTFVMTPRRHVVTAAKGIVAAAASVIATALAIVLAAASGLVSTATKNSVILTGANWQALLGSTIANLIYVFVGFAMGMAFLNAPAAITVILIVPTTVLPAVALVDQLHPIIPWLNYLQAGGPLTTGTIHGVEWAHLATSTGLWIALPIIIGLWRQHVREP